MSFPELETKRLKLCELTLKHTECLFRLFSNEKVVTYYDLEAMNQLSQAEKLIEFFASRHREKVGIRWAITLKGSNIFLGTCGFNSWNIKMKNAFIGYDLLPEYWGKGYTTEAVKRMVTEAFKGNLYCGQLHRIQADTVPGNIASETLLKKLGFKEEGIRREAGYWKNQFHDLKCFGLLKSDLMN